MAEVVGTAYVRIRAITAQLKKDIEDAVARGAKDADVNKAADDVGKRFSKRVASNIGDDVSESIGNALVRVDSDKAGSIVAKAYTKGFNDEASRALAPVSRQLGDSFSTNFLSSARRALGRADFDFAGALGTGDEDFFDVEVLSDSFTSGGSALGQAFSTSLFTEIRGALVQAGSDNTLEIDRYVDVDNSGRRFGDRWVEGFKLAAQSGFEKLKEGFGRIFDKMGQDNARRYGGGFRGTIARYLIALAPALVAPLAGAISLIIQYVITLIGQIGFLATAAVGAGVAIGTAFGAALLGIVPLLAAFAAETPELESLKAAAEDLGNAFKDMGIEVQRTLFPALEELFGLLEDDLLPSMTGFAQAIGNVSANLVRSVGEILRSQQAAGRLNTIWAYSADIFQSFGNAALNVFNGLIVLFTTALPIAQRFADSIENLAARWNLFITESDAAGTLGAQLQLWYDRAVLVFNALGDIAVGLWNIFTIGAQTATPFFDRFATWAQEWRDFTQSEAGTNRIKEVFDNASVVAHEFNLLVQDIMSRLFDSATDGENSVLVSVLRSIREDWLPGIDDILTRIAEQTGPELAELFVTVGDILQTLSDTGTLSVTATILAAVADSLEALVSIPGVGQLAGLILGIYGAFRILSLLRIPQIISGIAGAIGTLIGLFSEGGALYAVTTAITGAITALATALGVSFGVAAAIVAAVVIAIVGALYILYRNWGTVTDFLLAAWQNWIYPVADTIRDVVIVALEELGDALSWLWDTILKPVVDFLVGAFQSAWEAVGGAIETAAGFISDIGGTIFQGLIDGVMWLWQNVLVPFGNFLTDVFPTLWEAAGDAVSWFVDNVIGPVGDAISWLWDNVLVPFGQWLGERFAPLWDTIVQVWQEDIFPILQDLGERFAWFKDTILVPLGNWISTTFGPVWELLRGAMETVGSWISDTFGPIWDGLKTIFMNLWNNVLAPFIAFIRGDFGQAFLLLIAVLSPVAGIISGALTGAFMALWNNVLVPLWGFITSAFSVAWQLLVIVWQSVLLPALTAIGNALLWLWNEILVPLWAFITSAFSVAWQLLAFVWTNVVMPVLSALGAAFLWLWQEVIAPVAAFLLGSVIPIITALADALIGQLSFAISAVGAVISFVYNTFFVPFADFLQGAFTVAIGVAKVAWDGLKGAIDLISGAISYLWNTWLQPFLDFLAAGFAAGLNAAKAVINSIKNAFNDIAGAIESAWNWVQDLIDAINDIPALPDIGGGGGFGGFMGGIGGLVLGANGGIFNQATPMIIGEAGKEVLLPLTRPKRARELAAASGAYDVLLGGKGQTTSVTFGENSIQLQFSGVPSQSEARGLGREVGLGIQDVIAKRRINNGSRTA